MTLAGPFHRDLRLELERVMREYKNLEAEHNRLASAPRNRQQDAPSVHGEAEVDLFRTAVPESKRVTVQLRAEVVSLTKALSRERELLRQANERETKSFVNIRASQHKYDILQ